MVHFPGVTVRIISVTDEIRSARRRALTATNAINVSVSEIDT